MHRAALGAGALSDEWARERLPAHASRDDFVFLVAREQGELVGFAYGYAGAYGRWWTEHVAAAAHGASSGRSGSTHPTTRSSSSTSARRVSGAGSAARCSRSC